MCSYQEWESFTRRFRETDIECELREFVADVVMRIEEFIEDLGSHTCAAEGEERVRGCRRRSRTEWVA